MATQQQQGKMMISLTSSPSRLTRKPSRSNDFSTDVLCPSPSLTIVTISSAVGAAKSLGEGHCITWLVRYFESRRISCRRKKEALDTYTRGGITYTVVVREIGEKGPSLSNTNTRMT